MQFVLCVFFFRVKMVEPWRTVDGRNRRISSFPARTGWPSRIWDNCLSRFFLELAMFFANDFWALFLETFWHLVSLVGCKIRVWFILFHDLIRVCKLELQDDTAEDAFLPLQMPDESGGEKRFKKAKAKKKKEPNLNLGCFQNGSHFHFIE